MNTLNLIIIGVGPHSQAVYLPGIKELCHQYLLNIVAIVDTRENTNEVKSSMLAFGYADYEYIAVPERTKGSSYSLDQSVKEILDKIVFERDVRAIIISSDPFTHFEYLKWAIYRNLNILCDKPIVLHPNASTNIEQAQKIYDDYTKLVILSKDRVDPFSNKPLIFKCMLQRRYQKPFLEIVEAVKDTGAITGHPLSSINVLHNDGQFRFPEELVKGKYHGFSDGIGKVSHTGYHFIDLISWFLRSNQNSINEINNVKITSRFIRPLDIAYNINSANIQALFKRHVVSNPDAWRDDNSALEVIKAYGEVDAHIIISLLRDDIEITTINITLLHSGLSFRSWYSTKNDPLINMGRIKQESVILYQGPFLCAHFHKFRGTKGKASQTDKFGGEFHNEMNLLRNPLLTNKGKFAIRKKFKDSKSELGVSQDKLDCTKDFFSEIITGQGKSNLCLNNTLAEHNLTMFLMSNIYGAAASVHNGIIKEYRKNLII